jgi:hypothetical protein
LVVVVRGRLEQEIAGRTLFFRQSHQRVVVQVVLKVATELPVVLVVAGLGHQQQEGQELLTKAMLAAMVL